MSNQEGDALPLPQPTRNGPTAEDLRALAARNRWLQEHINWQGLRRLAYSRTSDAVIGNEAVQDVYHGMLDWTVEELAALRHPKAYARRAVLNRSIDLRGRSTIKTISLPDDYEIGPDPSPLPEKQLETREQVRNLLAELPESWRAPLVFIVVHGFTIEEAAAKLGLSHDTVKKRCANALKYLRIISGVLPPDSLVQRVKKLLQRKGRHNDE